MGPPDDDPSVADLSAMFAPHLILPTQYLLSHTIRCPEKALMLAVLQTAWDDATSLKGVPEAQKLRLAARWWIADDDMEWAYSFRRLCDAVGLSAEALRKALAASDAGDPVLRRRRHQGTGGNPPQPTPYATRVR